MSQREAPMPPELPPELAAIAAPEGDERGALNLAGALVRTGAGEALAPKRLHVEESELHGVATGCVMRGSSLEGVVGVESLRGLTMPWADLVGSTAALASALGIAVEPDL